LIKHQNNFIDLQTKFIEEKEKNFNFEKKILENELKEMKEVWKFCFSPNLYNLILEKSKTRV